jgi:hypothetical protein
MSWSVGDSHELGRNLPGWSRSYRRVCHSPIISATNILPVHELSDLLLNLGLELLHLVPHRSAATAGVGTGGATDGAPSLVDLQGFRSDRARRSWRRPLVGAAAVAALVGAVGVIGVGDDSSGKRVTTSERPAVVLADRSSPSGPDGRWWLTS